MGYIRRTIGGLLLIFLSSVTGFASIYQAETASLYRAVIETKNSGFIGDAYINFDNESGSYLEIRIGMLQAGVQEVKIRFANGGTASRPMLASLNNEESTSSLIFEQTGSWTNWDTLTFSLDFNAGVNLLRLTSTGSEGGPNIDQFEITGEQLPYYNLDLSVNGSGSISRIPADGLLFEGQNIRLIAQASVGSEFKEWQGDVTGTSDTLDFTIDADKSITAVFEEIDLDIPEPDFTMIGYATLSSDGVETTTGGLGADTIIIETLQELIDWGLSREDNYTAEFVIIKGYIEAVETEVITIKRGANITILGDPDSEEKFAELKNVSFNIRDYSNVIVRNLKMHEVWYPNDDLTIDHCHHVWVDHCEFHSVIGPGIGVDTYDGLLDIKKGSHHVTVSWCYFHDHMKTLLMGHSDNNEEQDVNLEATMHHNWFSNTNGRNPSLRFGHVHYFNNFLENIDDYGFAVRNGAHAKIENCHFESVLLPIATDKFEGHGHACVSSCVYTGTSKQADNQITEPLDCEFWSANLTYNYTLEDVNTVALSVQKYAGVGKFQMLDTIAQDTVGQDTTSVNLNHLEEIRFIKAWFIPAERSISIELYTLSSEQLTISLYSIDGKMLVSEVVNCAEGSQRIKLNVPEYSPGIYLLNIHNYMIRKTSKIILN